MNEQTQTWNEDTRVYVLAAAEKILVLRILLRQAIPMLKRPKDYGQDRRQNLATMIGLALDGMDVSLQEDAE